MGRGCAYTETGVCEPKCLGRGCRNKRARPGEEEAAKKENPREPEGKAPPPKKGKAK